MDNRMEMTGSYNWMKKAYMSSAPIWCSIDFPAMNKNGDSLSSHSSRRKFFKLLADAGVKIINIGIPSISETDYDFLQYMIQHNLIPEDVCVQVCVDADMTHIQTTLRAMNGVRNGILNLSVNCESVEYDVLYGSLLDCVTQLKGLIKDNESLRLQITVSKGLDYGVGNIIALYDAIIGIWQPKEQRKLIFTMPFSSKYSMPHVLVSKIEYIINKLKSSDNVMFSIRPGNENCMGVAISEAAVLAGVEMIEGRLLADSKEPDSIDLKHLISNMCNMGVESNLKIDHKICNAVCKSGKTTDIVKILRETYGVLIPDKMIMDICNYIEEVSDCENKTITSDVVYELFKAKYVATMPYFKIHSCEFKQNGGIIAEATITHGKKNVVVHANGNGRLDAVSNALKQYFGISYELEFYEEHALSSGSSSKAISYVGIVSDGKFLWGVGMDEDIITSSIHALCVAVNQIDSMKDDKAVADDRLIELMNYIQVNFYSVTLEELAHKFHLSEPYLSKYIKEKSGKTFGENLQNIRMTRAKSLLKNTSMSVEHIASAVGYQNVEHFDRTFKKRFQMTPVQYRNS